MVSLYYAVTLPSANYVEKSSIKVKRKTKFQTNVSFLTEEVLCP